MNVKPKNLLLFFVCFWDHDVIKEHSLQWKEGGGGGGGGEKERKEKKVVGGWGEED